jgi:hypothetical protein
MVPDGPTFPAYGDSPLALEGSDRPWVVSEEVWKAGIVHVEQFPKVVLPTSPTALRRTQVVRRSEGRVTAVAPDHYELVGIDRFPRAHRQCDSVCLRRSCVLASIGIGQSVPVIGENHDLGDSHSRIIAVWVMCYQRPLPAFGDTRRHSRLAALYDALNPDRRLAHRITEIGR